MWVKTIRGKAANFKVIKNTTDNTTRIICGDNSFQLEPLNFMDMIRMGKFIKTTDKIAKPLNQAGLMINVFMASLP